ncbi:hypothetical protein POL68_32585 [Stigmatella sp. ncwal1]|uniref:Uncharacterized protein n=1 Tax=Stigmatella ashevillensis TaxID=2995309 RepID=A0ABT5DHW5_9BACT|nr:hypothetical protein [Stigmatella ashevillena]MDC0713245.1 hypothetical protein [Stigmatella ashevillena]
MVKQFSQAMMAGWAAPAVALLLGAVEVQAAPVTDITVKNIRTASVTRTSVNISGYLSPTPLLTIAAGGTDIYGSYSSGNVDGGVIYYGGCRFNWSKILNSSLWTFSIGATPTATCAAVATVQNPFTGAYSLTFTTK